MPLIINVGLNRKASKNYQSAGCSVNLTAELDQSLLKQPQQLQQEIDDLYAQAHLALERKSSHGQTCLDSKHGQKHTHPDPAGESPSSPNSHRSYQNNVASLAQRQAIEAICQKLSLDPYQESRDILGIEYGHLDRPNASLLISHLQSLQHSFPG